MTRQGSVRIYDCPHGRWLAINLCPICVIIPNPPTEYVPRTASSVDVLRSARSVTELGCQCENTERNSYRGRKDGLWHCEQCDGVMPT